MITVFVLLILSFFGLVKPAAAYIDPGAGSYLVQIAIGSLLAGAYVARKFWRSIISFTTAFLKKLLGKKTT